ncbi:MAG: lipoyl(octanoyl) transferase LipB [Gemmatimonadetes bacterium]|nr:lipoyl(octanoyl) transferase LipB [Gemmatimonadota bacterium]
MESVPALAPISVPAPQPECLPAPDSAPAMRVLRLPSTGYGAALALQRRLLEERLLGLAPDTLILLSHPPIVTLGRGSSACHVLASEDDLRRRGIELWETDRGGDVTFHGPGQIVGYVIFDLRIHGQDLHRFLRRIEEAVLRALDELGFSGVRVPGLTGIWVDGAKVCAIGIKVSRWISMHGFALNVSTDLSYFDVIVPCGIADRAVTSLEELRGGPVERGAVENALVRGFAAEYGLDPAPRVGSREARQERVVA